MPKVATISSGSDEADSQPSSRHQSADQINIKGNAAHYPELGFISGRASLSCRNYRICIKLVPGYGQRPSRRRSGNYSRLYPRSPARGGWFCGLPRDTHKRLLKAVTVTVAAAGMGCYYLITYMRIILSPCPSFYNIVCIWRWG